jgi:hypothetical protein
LGAEFGEGTLEAAQAGTLQDEIQREVSLQDRLAGENRGDSQTAKQSRERMRKANVQLDKVRSTAAAKKKVRDAEKAAQAAKTAKTAKEEADDVAEFGSFDQGINEIATALGIKGETGNAKQEKRLERATLALAEGKSLKEARKAAGLDRKGGGRRKKKPKDEKKTTSPVSISEFLGASGRGELGALASRTPSTGDIEPTVAIDITNNTFTFSDTFNIEGKGDPVETGKQVVLQIKAEFDRRLGNAGQQMATNVVR